MQSDRDRIGAPERLDVPFELKALTTLRTDEGAQVGVFEGLASTFGAPDLVGDIIEPGAFRASLDRPRTVKMLWQHDPRAPIGVWDRIAETATGLTVKGRLVLDVQQAREALALLRAGAVDALSIGFSVPKGGWSVDREKAVRRLSRIDLWEISVVTFPANPDARIARVKGRAAHGALPSEREFERFLTRDAGFSRSQARIIVGSGYKALKSGALTRGPSGAKRDAGRGPARGDLEGLAARIRRVAALIADSTEKNDSHPPAQLPVRNAR